MIFPVQVYLQLSPVWITAFILLPFILKHSKSATFSCLAGPFLTLIIMLYVYRSNVKDIIHIIAYMIFIYWIQYIYNFSYIKQLPYTVCLQHMEVIMYQQNYLSPCSLRYSAFPISYRLLPSESMMTTRGISSTYNLRSASAPRSS